LLLCVAAVGKLLGCVTRLEAGQAMKLERVRFTIGQLMIAVAAIAFLLVWRDLGAALALVGLGLIVIIPTAIAPPGRRLEVASWASSLQPAVVLFYLYATWVTAWIVLGHCPRSSLDDPKFISPVVDVPFAMFAFSMLFGFPICACTGFFLAAVCCARRSKPLPLVALPFAWLAGYIALMLDPLRVLDWYMD
jgi:hypothetical protein